MLSDLQIENYARDEDRGVPVEASVFVVTAHPGKVVCSFDEFREAFPDAAPLEVIAAKRAFDGYPRLALNVYQVR